LKGGRGDHVPVVDLADEAARSRDLFEQQRARLACSDLADDLTHEVAERVGGTHAE
jgi:hypothetical protein